MATDIDALTGDMLKFASLLKLVARPGPAVAVTFADYAVGLRDAPSVEAEKEVREWLFLVLRHTGNNSIFDRYVVKDGEISTPLSREYLDVAGRLRQFGNPSRVKNPYRVKKRWSRWSR